MLPSWWYHSRDTIFFNVKCFVMFRPSFPYAFSVSYQFLSQRTHDVAEKQRKAFGFLKYWLLLAKN